MRLPWCSRSALDAAEKRIESLESMIVRLDALTAYQRSEITSLHSQYHDLVKRTLEMKRAGYEPTLDYTANAPVPDAELAPAILAAIEERAQPGTPLYRQLCQWSARQVVLQAEESDITDQILAGGTWD